MSNIGKGIAGLALGASLLTLSGCAGWSAPPWGGQSTGASPNGLRSASAGTTSGSAAEYSAYGSPGSSGTASVTNPASWSAGLRHTKDKVVGALTIKPKVVPVNDPSRLDARAKPLSPDLFLQAARLAEVQGNLPVAQQNYEKALELNPRHVEALVAYARLHDRQGRPDLALALYQRARTAAPNSALVCNDIGLCQARRGDYPSALTALEQAATLDPANQRYRNNLAAVLVEVGRPDDAVTALRAIHSPAVAHYNVGYLLHARGRDDQAAPYLAEALRTDPTLAAAQTLLAQLNSGPGSSPPAATPPPAVADNHRVWAPTHKAASVGPVEAFEISTAPADNRAWRPAQAPNAEDDRDTPREASRELRKFPRVF